MISLIKDEKVKEFGDFQTPRELAFEICLLLSKLNVQPGTIVEPNCGLGSFIGASRRIFHSAKVFGFDIALKYIEQTRNKFKDEKNISILEANFFETDWKELFKTFKKPILVLGNPPWVTNSQLSVLDSKNIPQKENFQKFSGLDAMTGKSNFDISEWMLIRLFEALTKQDAALAMLCKTSVARKVLKYAWKNKIHLANSAIYRIETEKHFNASVDSCLLFCEFSESFRNTTAKIFESLEAEDSSQEIGFKNDELIASVEFYEKWKYLNGGSEIKWRSGIKHDCSKIMELVKTEGNRYKNGLNELVELEEDFIYPLLKSSDIANGNIQPRRWVLVTQEDVKGSTSKIAEIAPNTWNYLISHGEYLDNRRSSIYKKRSRFSIFGIGDYSFAPWKVAISGFYKKLKFNVIGSYEKKPIVLDDTCYFIPFENEKDARKICDLLNSEIGREFFEAYIFWDAKRPITVEILQKLNIAKLCKFVETATRQGRDEAFQSIKRDYENELTKTDIQNSFDF
ncbi:MAG: SAM-dependent methyltransferase [Acidobacteriota bacterium]|nr:SAM-dependent methyltransferase [Acidobacteriota bacterium]